MTRPHQSISHRKNQAFTLIEIAVVLVIVAIMISMAAFFTRGLVAAQKRSTTASRMATVDAALLQFAIVNKRLPCPADGTRASGDALAGAENPPTGGPCQNLQRNGVVPWAAIGISESDASDGWDRRLTYRVAPDLAAPPGLDMYWCDPAGTAALVGGACTPNCSGVACTSPSNFLALKGLTVKNAPSSGSQTTIMSPPPASPSPPVPVGAAYVVISHGESGGGARLSSGSISTSSSIDGIQEQKNYVDKPYDPSLPSYLVDEGISDAAGDFHFDDIVSRPSVMAIVQKAGLGPRAH